MVLDQGTNHPSIAYTSCFALTVCALEWNGITSSIALWPKGLQVCLRSHTTSSSELFKRGPLVVGSQPRVIEKTVGASPLLSSSNSFGAWHAGRRASKSLFRRNDRHLPRETTCWRQPTKIILLSPSDTRCTTEPISTKLVDRRGSYVALPNRPRQLLNRDKCVSSGSWKLRYRISVHLVLFLV
ncbi:hypothetical protein EDD22DRAFT_158465 [Suillus occidentalis]|nr:hypothetical protein EDD22DRAFT_158465 [Suillus occidentalis]